MSEPNKARATREFGPIFPMVLFAYPDIGPMAKICLLRLRWYAYGRAYCYPKIETLAADLNVSDRTVYRLLEELREAKFIAVEDRRHERRSNVYTLLAHPLFAAEEPSVEETRARARKAPPLPGDDSGEVDLSETSASNLSPDKSDKLDLTRVAGRPETNQLRQIRESAEPTAAARPAAWKLGAARLDAVSDPEPAAGGPSAPEPTAASRPLALREPGRAKARPSPPSHRAPTPKTFDPRESGKSQRAEPDEDPAEAIEEETPFDVAPEKPSSERLKDASEFAERLRQDLLAKRGASFQAAADKKARVGNFESDGMSGASASLRARGQECRKVWFAELGIAFPDVTIAQFGAKENAQLKTLLEKYGGSIVADALRYVVREWASIRKRYMKGRLGPAPSLGWILACHEQLFSESQVWAKHAPVLQEWAEWWKRNPNNPYPPSDLKARYREAEKELGWMDRG